MFTKPEDEISLLLVGTENELISNGFSMAPADWDMIRYVKSLGLPKHNVNAEWLDGVVVAMEYLKSLR